MAKIKQLEGNKGIRTLTDEDMKEQIIIFLAL